VAIGVVQAVNIALLILSTRKEKRKLRVSIRQLTKALGVSTLGANFFVKKGLVFPMKIIIFVH
jgi:hypothetical protein